MPTSTASYVSTYVTASDIPLYVLDALISNERYTNTVLPHLIESRARERAGENPQSGQCWVVYSTPGSRPAVDLVLACIEGPLGSYPIFIASTRPFSTLTDDFLVPRLTEMIDALLYLIPTSRVFSIFSPAPITQVFAELWGMRTRIGAYYDPYYDATVSFCTKQTLTSQPDVLIPEGLSYELRPAVESDISKIAYLCWLFALDAPPFLLTEERAYEEAAILIRKNQVWVHAVNQQNGAQDIASIVAITRTSAAVATITKVMTNPNWRRRGCAERLVRRVCKHLLQTKDAVMLYVGHDNTAANVYSRVGFPGLSKKREPVEGVDHWLELGFDTSKVTLGHW